MLRRDLKRKKRDIAAGKIIAVYKPRPPKTRRYTPGRDRTIGYYGRMGGMGGQDGELKFKDVTMDEVGGVPTGGVIRGSVNTISQGNGESQRDGRKCTIRMINWKLRWLLGERVASASVGAGDQLRTILYLDKQCNGTAAAVLDILETADFQSWRNLVNSGRFSILMDKTISLNYHSLSQNGAGNYSAHNEQRHTEFHKKCNIPIEFNGTTGVQAEIRSNNLGVLFISGGGVGIMHTNMRVRFSG